MVKFKVAHVSFPQAKFWLRMTRYDVLGNNIKGGHYMTKNQIEYMRVQNQARKDRADVSAKLSELAETKRTHLATEDENRRANYARESENTRSNLERERQNQLVINETNRANVARERENQRSNLAQEAIANFNSQISARNAAANVMNANTALKNAETAEYNATANVNNMLLQDVEREARVNLIKQQEQESAAKTEYYNTQTGLAIPGQTLKDVINAVKMSAEMATIFAQ